MTTQFTIFSQSIISKINAYFEENPHTDSRFTAQIPTTIFKVEELKEILSHCQVDDYEEGMFYLYFQEYTTDYKIKAQVGFEIKESKCIALGFTFERPFCVDDTESWEYTWHGW